MGWDRNRNFLQEPDLRIRYRWTYRKNGTENMSGKTGDIAFLRDREMDGLEIRFARQTPHAFPKHAHDGVYLIGLMERGGAWCVDEGDETSFVAPGELSLFNPGQIHTGIPRPGQTASYRMFYLSGAFMRGIALDVTEGKADALEFERVVIRQPRIWSMLMGLTGLIETGCDRLERDTVLFSALAGLIADHAGHPTANIAPAHEPKAVRIAREYLSERLSEKMTLEDAAREAGLSRHHFIRVFSRATGFSPHAYRTLRRIDRAKSLLLSGVTPAEAALETGFVDQSHFTNVFKKIVGATPGQYLSR